MKGFIFDLDGTLTNTLNAIAHFANGALMKFGMAAHPVEDYKKYVGDGRDKLIHRALASHGRDTEELFELVGKAYDAAYEADFLYDTNAYDGVAKLLEALKRSGKKIAVCSNKPDNVVHFVTDTIFGADYFDLVLGHRADMKTKPDPDTALNIAKTLGLECDECVFIGDTNVDIFTGKNAGMTTVGVLWGFRGLDELQAAGADFIVSSPEQIIQLFN